LGPATLVGSPALGAWCWHTPLWGGRCPLLPALEAPQPQQQAAWEAEAARLRLGPWDDKRAHSLYWRAQGFAPLADLPTLRTAGDLVATVRRLNAWDAQHSPPRGPGRDSRAAGQAFPLALWGRQPGRLPLSLQYTPPAAIFAAVMGIWQSLSPAWRKVLGQQYGGPKGDGPKGAGASPELAPLIAEVGAMGWQQPLARPARPNAAAPQPICALSRAFSVRAATALQLGPSHAARLASHRVFVSSALGPGATDAALQAGLAQLGFSLRQAWAIRWDNIQKEAWWRLTAGGVPAAGGHGIYPASRPCVCGWVAPASLPKDQRPAALQRHAFWADLGDARACPVAAAVLAELRRALPAAAAAALTCADLWLLQPPAGGRVHGGVWAVVGLAAVAAMAHGRRYAWRLHMDAEEARTRSRDGRRQATLEEAWGLAPPPPGPMARAARNAAADFWCRLGDFASLGPAPEAWKVAPGAPFLAAAGEGSAQLVVNMPEA
jgi:hypothetical protein